MAAVGSVAAGCGPSLEFEYLESPPPVHAMIDADRIAIELGTAVGVRVTNGGTEFDEDVRIAMSSAAPQVLTVEPSLDPDEFVLWGVSQGSTTVTVALDGEDWETIPAMVYRP